MRRSLEAIAGIAGFAGTAGIAGFAGTAGIAGFAGTIAVAGLLVVLTSGPASAAGCQAFGSGRVAVLAQDLGPVFGQTASGVASSSPNAFPTFVVKPEQSTFCG